MRGCIWVQGFTRLPHAGSLKFPSQPYNYVERVCVTSVMLCSMQKPFYEANAVAMRLCAMSRLNLPLSPLQHFPIHLQGPSPHSTAAEIQPGQPSECHGNTSYNKSASSQDFPHASVGALSLLNKLLTYDPAKRLSARAALRAGYFQEQPPPKQPADFPTFPSAHDTGLRQKHQRRCSCLYFGLACSCSPHAAASSIVGS